MNRRPTRQGRRVRRSLRGPAPVQERSLPERVAGRFVLQQLLGRGGSGSVYRAFDEQRGEPVAIKFLTKLEPGALYRFKSEFRRLANLTHPHLVQLHELLHHEREWLLTMELIEGCNFLDYVRPRARHAPTETRTGVVRVGSLARERAPRSSAELDLPRLKHAFLQLSDGLQALHRAERLHRDLKPENVLVADSGKRVVICDFGLALASSQTADTASFDATQDIGGTAEFMSPEQTVAGQLTAASDWYSVGVMLYLALTGQVPFERTGDHRSTRELKLTRPARDPREHAPDVPAQLAEVALQLLDPDPARRAAYAELVSALEGGHSRGVRYTRARRVFVGREQPLSQLEAAFAASRRGAASLAFVSGPSGGGKTALVQHFLSQLEERADALVLSARCYEHEALPYKALDPLMDALAAHLVKSATERVEPLLPSGTPFLAAMFPALCRVPAIARMPLPEVADPRERRRLAFRALRYLLRNLAAQRPLVLFVDDMQWGDLDSGPAIIELLRSPHAPRLLLVCAYRQEGERLPALVELLRDAPELEATQPARIDIRLGALEPQEASRLARVLLPEMPNADAAAERIAREAEGSPLFVSELVAYLAEHGSAAVGSLGFDALIRAKLAALPSETSAALELIAIAGRPLSAAIARAASRLGTAARKAQRALEQQRLVLITHDDSGDLVECYHDRIRDCVCGTLDRERARLLHRSLAEVLESHAVDDCDALREHWRGAGEPGKASHYARIAAQRAEQALAFTRAVALYREAVELLPAEDPGARALQERLGQALILAGRGVEAAAVFTDLMHGAPLADALRFRMLATTQLLRGGKLVEGYAELARSQDLFGVGFAASVPRALGMSLLRQARIRLREHSFVLRPERIADEDSRARLEALWEVAAAVSNADYLRGSIYGGELMLQALQVGDPAHVAGACGLQAIISAAAHEPARAQRMFDRAGLAGTASGRLQVLGRVKGMQAVCRYLQGQWLTSKGLARESQELHRRGAIWNWDNAIMVWWEMMATCVAGQVAEVTQRVPEALRDAEARGDIYAATEFRSHRAVWAWLGPDRPDLADQQVDIAEREWLPSGYQFQHWHMTLARAEIDLYRRSPERAFERLNREWRSAWLVRQVQGPRVEMRFTRARLALALAGQAPRRKLLERARSDARSLRTERVAWAVALGDMLLAALASFSDTAAAAPRLSELDARFRGLEMPLHADVCRARSAQLNADEQAFDSACAAIRARGVAEPRGFLELLLPMNTRPPDARS